MPGPPRPVAPTNDTEALDTEALDTDALGAEALNEPLGMGSQNGAASSTPTGDDDPAADGAVRAAGGSGDLGGDLRRRAEAVEAMPLAERADAFTALHDDLRTRLEQGGAARA
ncbi:hypothetical protein DEJ32_12595 [Curtobacterium sp. MCPF17_046]|nr:hypothetical protein DEJ32_12595 [Curtobacterium sp. MCPF17_046]PYY47467.1 hypothetical protein DEI84_10940 [Curtobacterium sp. MCBD17_023]